MRLDSDLWHDALAGRLILAAALGLAAWIWRAGDRFFAMVVAGAWTVCFLLWMHHLHEHQRRRERNRSTLAEIQRYIGAKE